MKKIIPIFGIALIVVVILVYMFNGNKTEKITENRGLGLHESTQVHNRQHRP